MTGQLDSSLCAVVVVEEVTDFDRDREEVDARLVLAVFRTTSRLKAKPRAIRSSEA